MNVLGIKFIGHDVGAALISQGKIVAISEERLNRIKHSRNIFPEKSVEYCLEALNLKYSDISLVVTDSVWFLPNQRRGYEETVEKIKTIFSSAGFKIVNHHDLHAASAFFASPFLESAVLVYDGSGEAIKNHLGVIAAESETTYFGQDNSLHQIRKTAHRRDGTKAPEETFGIGALYTFLSQRYLGFGQHNEGKMMGLASYGDDSIFKKFPFEKWCREDRGEIVCNPRINYPPRPFRESFKKTSWKGLPVFLAYRLRYFVGTYVPYAVKNFFDYSRNRHYFEKIYLPRPPRGKDTPLPDPYYASVAYMGQKILEEAALRIAKELFAITRSNNIAISGGVGLNIDANRRILDESGFKNIFIQPGASDAGIALGAALYGYHVILNQPRFFEMTHAYLGREYLDLEIRRALSTCADKISFSKSKQIAVETAKLISQGNIVGWFQGGSEYGPRALGHRSIIGDARNPETKDIMNKRVKHREPWRPFAASVLKEAMGEFFDLTVESAFMILLGRVYEKKRSVIPSVVHVDGTCRLQTVTKEANGIYYDLIKEFQKLTGVGLVLNTSFNLGGEPIVETPEDALDSFLRTDMDYLVIGEYLIKKK